MGLAVDDTPVPIVCLVLGDAENMRRIQAELQRQGLLVAYMAATRAWALKAPCGWPYLPITPNR